MLGSFIDECSNGTEWNTWNNIRAYDYNEQQGLLSDEWPAWMSTDYTDPGEGNPAIPGNGAIYRWGNENEGGSYFGYYRLDDGPTGPADKGVWKSGTIE